MSFDQKPQLSMNKFIGVSSSSSEFLIIHSRKGVSHLSVISRSIQIKVLSRDQIFEATPGIGIEIIPSEIIKERSFIMPQIRFIAEPLNFDYKKNVTKRAEARR
ncbi:hypothetical protein FGO68_gene11928 [Halteria grandinella]|uniref:Uncharacterized protein n=1 Tax=Halteria grandinella TaxID=5974 RepID=A0A8J8P6J7_HALGN|nr:hypothetical protein FGO68_gene11928 [Halteria grandinella]